jgi:hypothetical protein
MKQKSNQEEKVYHTMVEFEKEFFPNAYEKKLAEKRSKDPKSFGAVLAMELLENIRRQLSQQSEVLRS